MQLRALQAAFAITVSELIAKYPASVTSWHRTPERNARVDGHPNSYHLLGLAADLVLNDETQHTACVAAAHQLGLDALDEHTHVHVELDARRLGLLTPTTS